MVTARLWSAKELMACVSLPAMLMSGLTACGNSVGPTPQASTSPLACSSSRAAVGPLESPEAVVATDGSPFSVLSIPGTDLAVASVTTLSSPSVGELETSRSIGASVARLGTVFPSVEAYLDLFRHSGIMEPWSDYWEHYFRYELQPVDGGVAARTSRAAVMEDVMFGAGACAFGDAAGVYGLWASLSMPVLLLRATREMILGTGFILSKRDRDRFPVMVESATAVDIDANHYTIATSEAAASAIIRFL